MHTLPLCISFFSSALSLLVWWFLPKEDAHQTSFSSSTSSCHSPSLTPSSRPLSQEKKWSLIIIISCTSLRFRALDASWSERRFTSQNAERLNLLKYDIIEFHVRFFFGFLLLLLFIKFVVDFIYVHLVIALERTFLVILSTFLYLLGIILEVNGTSDQLPGKFVFISTLPDI